MNVLYENSQPECEISLLRLSHSKNILIVVNSLHPHSSTLQYDISIFCLAWQSSDEAVMTECMKRAYRSVPVNSFVFERTFSCRTPFPYSPTNSHITASRLLSSSLLPAPSLICDCLFGRFLIFGDLPLIIFPG